MRHRWFLTTSEIKSFVLVPAEWEELPLSELQRHCLYDAVEGLPRFLASPIIALDDDEVVGFTQNGGWQKIDKLLPLVIVHPPYYIDFWYPSVHLVSDKLKVSQLFSRRLGRL